MTIKETLVCSGCMVTSTPLNHSTQYISGAIRRMISYLQMHMTAHCTQSLTFSTFADDDVTILIQDSSESTQDKVSGNTAQPSSDNLGGMRKAARMRFSQEQIQTLEQRFQEQHYLLPADRKLLAHSLGMSERQVKTWFQNKRAQCKRARILSSPSLQQPLQAHATYSFTWPYSLHPLPPPPLSPLASFSLMQNNIEQRPLLLAQTSFVPSPSPPSLPLLARQYYASCHAGTH